MRRRKLIIAALMVALLASFFPKRAYAYVDYSGSGITTGQSAAYQYIRDYGGGSSLPDVNDLAAFSFFQNVVMAPSSPLYYFAYNYTLYVPFSGWRVFQASDFQSDVDAMDRYDTALDNATDFLLDEWERWQEDFPGSSGGDSGSGDVVTPYGAIYVLHPDVLVDGTYTFPDGSTMVVPSGTAANFGAKGVSYYFYYAGSNHELNSFSIRNMPNGRVGAEPYIFVINPLFNAPADASFNFGFYGLLTNGAYSGLRYVQASSNVVWSNNSSVALNQNVLPYVPDGFGFGITPNAYGNTNYSFHYILTNMPVYSWNTLLVGDTVVDPDAPIGPTVPDYEIPDPYQPVNPTLPNITNNVTNNPVSYTGNETDYSDYLKIIIDNQNEQIDQVYDFAAMVDANWDAFNNWLNIEFDNILGYLTNYQQFWNTLLEYVNDMGGDLFEFRMRFQEYMGELNGAYQTTWGWLRDIYNKIGSSSGNQPSFPDIGSDLEGEGGFFDWLFGLFGEVLDALIGSASAIAGATDLLGPLMRCFPFSLPWDLIAIVTLLVHEPVSDYILYVPILDGATSSGSVSWSSYPCDLSVFADVFVLVRFGILGAVCIGLIFKTRSMLNALIEVVGS